MNKKGFTLIEILSVLVIVSILVVISIPSISDILEKSKQRSKEEVLETVKSAAEMYAIDYKIGLAEPILMTELCKNYLKCPIKDPITDEDITGYLYSRIDKTSNNSKVFELKSGEPIRLNNTILDTVNGKDIAVNKYAGNGLYKWGDKYIYRGGLTKSNTAGLSTADGYLTDTTSGTDVNNFVKVPWETYSDGETCNNTSNKCYRIMGINKDGSINIIRDRVVFNQVFDDIHNTSASNNYSQPSINYGYNSLLENIPTKGHQEEQRQFSKMYIKLYGQNGYESTLISYKTMLEEVDVCLNRLTNFSGLNDPSYSSTTRVTDSCNITGKPNTGIVYPLKSRLFRLPYIEEYLNVSLDSTCYKDYDNQYQCRNQNYMFGSEVFFSQNPSFENSWSINALFYGMAGNTIAKDNFGVRPVMTLKKDVIITSGNGTSNNPYIIAN